MNGSQAQRSGTSATEPTVEHRAAVLGRRDWAFGTGATATERRLVWSTAAVGVAAVVWAAETAGVRWAWWQWALVALVTVDVVGGVVANSLGSAKRFYHGPAPQGAGAVQQVLHHPVGFATAHVHPFVLVPALGGSWAWAVGVYVTCLAGVALVTMLPRHLQRPAAFAIATLALLAAPSAPSPDGLAWFGPVLVLKLVVAHAVPEEPYRPRTATAVVDRDLRPE